MADTLFRIATFNLENLDDDADEPPFEERIATLRPQLERLEADILCLQEVDAQHPVKSEPRILRALTRLLEGTRYAGYHVTAGDAPSPADRLHAGRMEETVRAAMRRLPAEQALVLRLSYYEDQPHAQIARELGIPLGTVKSRVRLAVNHMRRLMSGLES